MTRSLFSLLLACFVLAGFSFWIKTHFYGKVAASTDPLYQFLGSAKEAIGDTFFLKADVYFHGGIESKHEHKPDEGKHDHDHHHDQDSDPIAWINHERLAGQHMHLGERDQKEILPFIAWATQLDPHNITAILTAAYWLERHFGKIDQAVEMLNKGLRDNPDAWEIHFRLADVLFRRFKDYEKCIDHYSAALKNLDEDATVHDRIDIYFHLGECAVALGQKEQALEYYRTSFSLFPPEDKTALKKMIARKVEVLSNEPDVG